MKQKGKKSNWAQIGVRRKKGVYGLKTQSRKQPKQEL